MRRRQRGLQFYRKKKGLSMQAVKEVFSWIVLSVLAVFLAFMVIWAVGLRTNMIGVSMEPGLTNGQGILVNRLKYRFFSPQTGDVVVFLPNGNQNAHYYVKRVVAVPGQTVLIQDGILYIDGKAQENEEMDLIASAGIAVKSSWAGTNISCSAIIVITVRTVVPPMSVRCCAARSSARRGSISETARMAGD